MNTCEAYIDETVFYELLGNEEEIFVDEGSSSETWPIAKLTETELVITWVNLNHKIFFER
ncbi:MAG: hypothetical protein R2783_01205 [Gelidibacter sp.]